MSNVKFQIFLSSTYEDLTEHRAALSRAVLSIGHIPVGMEGFNASDEDSWALIRQQIDQCDYYAVIVAHKYGSTNEDGVSYTELEYNYARSKAIPCLGFIIDQKAPWPSEKMESSPEAQASLGEFKALVKEKQVAYWTNEDDLGTQFLASIVKAFNSSPRTGWVRADESHNSQMSAELTRLSRRNAELQGMVDRHEAESEMGEKYEVRILANKLRRINKSFFVNFHDKKDGVWEEQARQSLYKIFSVLAPKLVTENTTNHLRAYYVHFTEPNWLKKEDKERKNPKPKMPKNTVQDWLATLMSFDLTKPSERRHAVKDNAEYWTLDKTGIDLLKHITLLDLDEAEERGSGAIEDESEAKGKGTVATQDESSD